MADDSHTRKRRRDNASQDDAGRERTTFQNGQQSGAASTQAAAAARRGDSGCLLRKGMVILKGFLSAQEQGELVVRNICIALDPR